MNSLGFTGSLLWALVLVLLAFICTGHSFKQELWFYDAQDNALQFHTNVPDMAIHSLFMATVTKYCTKGSWSIYSEPDYQRYNGYLGQPRNTSLWCYGIKDAATVRSLRHFAASDTDTDALSLYENSTWCGEEIYVTARALTGIPHEILGVAGTGTSDWMLFEGQSLDGRSTCYQVPSLGSYISFDYVSNLTMGLSTVGSVFKGCDLQEIRDYKRLQTSL